jgi:hypothetical protein
MDVFIIRKEFSFTCPSGQAGRISRGSLYELKDHLLTSYDLGFINNTVKMECEELIEDAKVTLNGFINFVKSKIK